MNEEDVVIKQWQEWNRQGLFPGPDELQEAFEERVKFCQNLSQHFEQSVGDYLPFKESDASTTAILEEGALVTQMLYGIQPHWVPLFFNNYQLSPWHGGCAWIFQLNENTPTAAFLQLRSSFHHSSTYLGLYQRRELIAHELSHVGRMLYQEPQFEEFFAYQSSDSKWRRWFGPIVQSSAESFLFILLLGFVILMDFALLSLGPTMSDLALMVKVLPIAALGWALGRLSYRHRVLKQCLEKLMKIYPPQKAKHLLYRLRDSEIKQWSQFSPLEIKEFIHNAVNQSFRWRFLNTIYSPSDLDSYASH